MDIPKTAQEFAIWVGMQFPVLGAAVLVGRWLLRWSAANHAAEKEEIEKRNRALLDEKERRIAERDLRSNELRQEIDALKAKFYRSRPKGPDPDGGSSS